METQHNSHPNGPHMGIGFFFLSLGVLASLVTTVVSFLNLLFATLDKKFPDVLNATYQYGYNSYDYESIRGALATLIIFFPVFLILSYFWNKTYIGGVSRVDEIVRKWMLYVILFLSSLVIIIDLITLVRYFIAGEITNRFIYKVLGALLVAVFVGVHYIFELKGKKKLWMFPVGLTGAIKSTAWVILLVWFSFAVMGSPAEQRKLRLDETRINDLQSIQSQVVSYFQQKQKLPVNLDEFINPISSYLLPVDPEFEKGLIYEYKVLDAKGSTFELCATFSLPTPTGRINSNYGRPVVPTFTVDITTKESSTSYPYLDGIVESSWNHEAGRTCFERRIDKDLYPPYPKTPIGL